MVLIRKAQHSWQFVQTDSTPNDSRTDQLEQFGSISEWLRASYSCSISGPLKTLLSCSVVAAGGCRLSGWALTLLTVAPGAGLGSCALWAVYEMAGPVLPDGYDVTASFLSRCRGSRRFVHVVAATSAWCRGTSQQNIASLLYLSLLLRQHRHAPPGITCCRGSRVSFFFVHVVAATHCRGTGKILLSFIWHSTAHALFFKWHQFQFSSFGGALAGARRHFRRHITSSLFREVVLDGDGTSFSGFTVQAHFVSGGTNLHWDRTSFRAHLHLPLRRGVGSVLSL